MEAIIKYSQLIEDDGGFDTLRKDLDALGTDLVKKATAIKGSLSIVDPNDVKAIEKLQTEVDTLKNAYSELGYTQELLKKTEEEYIKTVKKSTKAEEEKQQAVKSSTDALDELYIQVEQQKLALKILNKMESENLITVEEAAIARGRQKLMMKDLNKEIANHEKLLNTSNTTSKKENDLIQAKLALETKQVETLDQIRERMKNLRIVVQNTNITTVEGREAIKSMNAEIDELTDTLAENSDKFIKNKINIGNYKESIIEALEETDLFKTNIGFLDVGMKKLMGVFKKTTETTEQNTDAIQENAKGIEILKKGMKGLGTALKATGIGLFIALLGTLFATFKSGRSGVAKTEQAMAMFDATMKVLINTLSDFGKGLFMWIKSFGPSIQNLGLYVDKLGLKFEWLWTKINPGKGASDLLEIEKQLDIVNKKLDENAKKHDEMSDEAWDKMGDAVMSYARRVQDAKNSINTSLKGIEQAFIISDKIRSAELELIGLRKQMSALEIASDDSTQSMTEMLNATRKVGEKGKEVFAKEIDILKMQLQLANTKAKADLEASGMKVRSMNIENGQLQTQIDFAKQLLALNKALPLAENNLDDNLLEDQQNALRTLMEKQAEYSTFKISLAKQEREIKRDLFEQDLDLLIDFIDKEKNLSEQFVNDVTKNFESRISEAQSFVSKFAKNAQDEMDLFTRTASDQGLDLDFKVNWNDDGTFDVFMDDQHLALDNVVKLNEQMQKAGLSQQAINRFREFVVESQAAVKDFKDINQALAETKIKIAEIRGERIVDDKELENLKKTNEEYAKLNTGKELSKKEKDKILKSIEKLEKEKTEYQLQGEEDRLRNRLVSIENEKLINRQLIQEEINGINKRIANTKISEESRQKLREKAKQLELSLIEDTSKKEIELNKEKTEIEIQLEEKKYEKTKKAIDEVLAKKAEWEQFAEDLKEIFSEILDKYVEVQQKQVDATEKRISAQEKATDSQRARAESGLENTLAFEQRELAKRESDKIKAQKKMERAEKIRALWTSYSANSANKEEKNPILKTLRDFAILEAFTASFGDGGLAEDKIPHNGKGITRGRSHKGRFGGIPVLIEGNEGFFSGREVSNLGRENFYDLKEMAGRGPIEKSLFKQQRERFVATVSGDFGKDNRIVSELRELKDIIASKPSSEINLPEVVDGILNFVETVTVGNKRINNHYKIKRPRL